MDIIVFNFIFKLDRGYSSHMNFQIKNYQFKILKKKKIFTFSYASPYEMALRYKYTLYII